MSAIPTERGLLSTRLSGAVLVVAHPDDEILWFSSILTEVAKVIVCFGEVPGQPEWTKGRAEVAEKFPLEKTVFLNLTESVAFGVANWADPKESVSGLQLDRPERALSGFSPKRYEQNFSELSHRLPPLVEDCTAVVTHNPWGEYGHEEHVQVFRAVRAVAARLSLPLWYSNYVSDRSAQLMIRTLGRAQEQVETFVTKPEVAAPIEQLYRQHGCWTWPYDDYRYFDTETFILDPGLDAKNQAVGNRVPLNYLDVDGGGRARPPAKKTPLSFRQKVRRVRQKLREGKSEAP